MLIEKASIRASLSIYQTGVTYTLSEIFMNTHVRILLLSLGIVSAVFANDLSLADEEFVCRELNNAIYNYAALQCELDGDGNICRSVMKNDLDCTVTMVNKAFYKIMYTAVSIEPISENIETEIPAELKEILANQPFEVFDEIPDESVDDISYEEIELLTNPVDQDRIVLMSLKCLNSIKNEWFCGFGSVHLSSEWLSEESAIRFDNIRTEILESASKLISTL
jgi:hypothetical protein